MFYLSSLVVFDNSIEVDLWYGLVFWLWFVFCMCGG